MVKEVAYIRVSSMDQNLNRQRDEMLNLGIAEKYIYEDKQSGKDFERIGYQ
ncbi:recombinase family protein, partial [Neobacillus vireti]|uniref:recombinase family protein n=1 Tax=Neobacillus vireti TaxID=220686 RepID=UPI002FFE31CD